MKNLHVSIVRKQEFERVSSSIEAQVLVGVNGDTRKHCMRAVDINRGILGIT